MTPRPGTPLFDRAEQIQILLKRYPRFTRSEIERLVDELYMEIELAKSKKKGGGKPCR